MDPAASFFDASYRALQTFQLPDGVPTLKIGVVFPMFDESQRLRPRTLENPYGEDAFRTKIKQLLDLRSLNPGIDWTLVAVEDGEFPPSPSSAEVAEALLQDTPGGAIQGGVWTSADGRVHARVLYFPHHLKKALNGCKGGAVVWGLKFLLSTGSDLCIYTDTDVSADLRLLGLLVAPLKEGKQWVVGSRLHPRAVVGKRGIFGKLTSRLYSQFARALLPMPGIRDIQSGFKLFRKDVLEAILPVHGDGPSSNWYMESDFDYGLSFDSNLLARASLARGSSAGAEVPILWNDSPETSSIRKLGLARVALRMTRSLFKQRKYIQRFEIAEKIREQNRRMEDHHFEEMVEQQTHWWFKGRQSVIQAALARDSHGFAQIADVGCGAGDNTHLLNSLPGSQAVGIELDDHARALAARRFPSVRFLPGQAHELPLETSSMDLVCYFDVLEHLPNEAKVLKESRRCLRPEGSILITVPAYQWLWSSHDVALAHYRRYSKAELLDKLEAEGFRTISCTYFITLLFPLIAAARLLEIILHRPMAASPSGTNLRPLPVWVNRLGTALMAAEAFVIRRGVRLPFGSSLLVLAQKRSFIADNESSPA